MRNFQRKTARDCRIAKPGGVFVGFPAGDAAGETGTHPVRCFDCDLQFAGPVWNGVEINGVSAGWGAERRMVAAFHASLRSSHMVPLVVGWNGVSEPLLQPD